MCKIKETNIGIKKLDFREKREDWMILDDQFFTFAALSNVYSVTDIVRA